MADRKLPPPSAWYRAARVYNTLDALTSGNAGRIGRRARNIAVGRALGSAGVWRKLWGR